MKTRIIAFVALLFTLCLSGQNNEQIYVDQDLRLLLFEDSIERPGPNLNLNVGLLINGDQRDSGYYSVGVGYEIASLPESNLGRMFIRLGFVFNNFLTHGVELATYVEPGLSSRYNYTFLSLATVGEFRMPVGERFKIKLSGRFLTRPDIKYRWGESKIEHAVFIGLIYNLKI
jgi:hypothetical protein